MQLSEAAGSLSEAEQYANQLCWWTSLAETELLAAAIGRALSEGDVSPAMTWLVIERSKDHWPPARRMALLEVYGQQPNGVPSDKLFRFHIVKARLLVEVGKFEDASRVAALALSLPIISRTYCEDPSVSESQNADSEPCRSSGTGVGR